VNEALRRSAAHVLVANLDDPALDDATIHHLRRVLRLRDGESITATDGAGSWRTGVFARDRFEPVGSIVVELKPEPPLTVAVAPPKGDRADWLVQKCTEVGVDRIVLVDAERSVVRWDGDRAGRHMIRLRRIATEAALQSRRVWIPFVEDPVAAPDVLDGMVVAEPGGRALRPSDTAIAVGPEGGWSDDELAVAADRVSLGPHVLRVETAAIVAATLMVANREADR
jgi:16S rRNA (uracil1498-N3)-methyltransferase